MRVNSGDRFFYLTQRRKDAKEEDCLTIAEVALKLVLREQNLLTKDEQKRQLTLAAMIAVVDYAPDSELNVFSDLEGEDFYEYPDEDMNTSESYVYRSSLVSEFRSNCRDGN